MSDLCSARKLFDIALCFPTHGIFARETTG